jgi:hypothetical protein
MRVLKALGVGVVFALAFFGVLFIGFNLLNESHGRAVGPFMSGVTAVVTENMKKDLMNTPDKQLEQDSQAFSKKLYPVLKGAALGQVEAFLNDPESAEMREKMRSAGKAFSEQIVVPFMGGLSEGSAGLAGQMDSSLDKVRELGTKHQDIIESVTSGLKALKELAEKHPLPPLPGASPALPQSPRSIPGVPPLDQDSR